MANISKWTPEKEEIILTALTAKPTYAAACKAARISRTTLNRWRAEDKDFDARVQAARESGFDAVEDVLVERAFSGDTTAAIFMLKSWRRSKYGDKQELNITLTVRRKAEQLAAELGVPVDDVLAEAEAVASGSWNSWSPQP